MPNKPPGVGFSRLRFAPALNRLLVPAGRSGALDLVDPATGKVTTIGGLGSSGGGVIAADEGRGFVFAVDRTALMLDVVDPGSASIVSRAGLAGGPEDVRYVSLTGELWVTEPDRQQIEIFGLGTEHPPEPVHRAFLIVPGGPESLAIDNSGGRAYANRRSGTTVALDVRSRAEVARWPNGCKGSRGIALDESRGFLFVGCAEGKAVVLDVKNGFPLGALEIGDGLDAIDEDAALSHLYVAQPRSQSLAVIGVSRRGALNLLGALPTAPGARCLAVAGRGRLYLCDPLRAGLLSIRDPYPPSGN